jgi:hypothetical protein
MWLIDTYIGQSNVHGLGLFTKVPGQRVEVISRFDAANDRMFTPPQVATLPRAIRTFIGLRAFRDKRTGTYFLGGDYEMLPMDRSPIVQPITIPCYQEPEPHGRTFSPQRCRGSGAPSGPLR